MRLDLSLNEEIKLDVNLNNIPSPMVSKVARDVHEGMSITIDCSSVVEISSFHFDVIFKQGRSTIFTIESYHLPSQHA